MRSSVFACLILLWIGEGLATHAIGFWERPPRPPDLEAVLNRMAGWRAAAPQPIDSAQQAQLGATRSLSWVIDRVGSPETAGLLVVWFQSQRDGRAQPHSPQVCLPGNGWQPVETRIVTIRPRGIDAFAAKSYVVRRGGEQAVVLYWYSLPHGNVASEWASKLWTLIDAARYRRTDAALVRIVVSVPADSTRDNASATAQELGATVASALFDTLGQS